MARKPVRTGNRAAPGAAQTVGPAADVDIIVAKPPVLFPEGSYDVEVVGASLVTYQRSGSKAMELTLKEESTGDFMDLDRMLVHSAGGDSRQTTRNTIALTSLCDLEPGAHVTLKGLEERLNAGGIKAEVTIYVGTDMDGRPCNKLASVDALITDDEE
jgi:hypothetical protein